MIMYKNADLPFKGHQKHHILLQLVPQVFRVNSTGNWLVDSLSGDVELPQNGRARRAAGCYFVNMNWARWDLDIDSDWEFRAYRLPLEHSFVQLLAE